MNHLSKLLTVGMLLGAASVAHAQNWTKVYSCENGAAYIDVNQDERRNLQIVFRGEDMLLRMKGAGVVGPRFGDKEAAVHGIHAELRPITSYIAQPVSLGGVFYPWDFKKMIVEDANSPGTRVLEIEPQGSRLAIKVLYITTWCDNFDDHDYVCRGNEHKTYNFDHQYFLNDCHIVQGREN